MKLFATSAYRWGLVLILLLIVGIAPHTRAERVPDRRETASHIIVGVVDAVFERRTKEYNQFVVRIRVQRVEKGEGVVPGEFFCAYCFQRRTWVKWMLMPGMSGHSAVPTEGQRIRAFVHRRSGIWEGNYPNWFDPEKAD